MPVRGLHRQARQAFVDGTYLEGLRVIQNRYLVAGRWFIYARDEEHALERYYVEVVARSSPTFDWGADDPDETIELVGAWVDGPLIDASAGGLR